MNQAQRSFAPFFAGFAVAIVASAGGTIGALARLAAQEPVELTALVVPPPPGPTIVDRAGPKLQCAIYARQRTGFALTGVAADWWRQAEGRYARAQVPAEGAALLMAGTARGHIAVVTRVLGPREILIDHANWLGGGEITLGARVVDVSEAGDWSKVRVWHPPTDTLGVRVYPVLGFILADTASI